MTLRLRLAVAGGLILVVVVLTGYLLVDTVEASQLQQVDRQLEAALPVALGPGAASRPCPSRYGRRRA